MHSIHMVLSRETYSALRPEPGLVTTIGWLKWKILFSDDLLRAVVEQVAWGPGPRASQALMLAVRARALLDGRLAPSIDDVVALARPVLQHRMALTFAARVDGISIDDVVARLTQRIA